MARARLRTKLLAAVLSPLLFLGLFELFLRAVDYRYAPYASERAEEDWRLHSKVFERHPVLLWTLHRNMVIDEPEAGFPSVTSNGMGLRGPSAPGSRRPGELRILCLGDSVTFGMGVEDGKTWPEQLQRILAASPKLEGRPVHVLNGGIPGWSSVQGMRLLEQTGEYEPDVIVFWFGMNDVQPAWGRPDSRKGTDPGLLAELASALSGLRTVQLVSRIVDWFGSAGEGATRASIAEFADAVERLEAVEAAGGPKVIFVRCPEQIGRTVRQFARMIARAEEEGVGWVSGPKPLLLSITPAPDEVDLVGRVVEGPNGPQLHFSGEPVIRATVESLRREIDHLRSYQQGLAERRGLLPGGSPGAEDFFGDEMSAVMEDNCHPNADGCRRVAEVLAARILERLGL